MIGEMLILRLLHVVSAVFWVGAVLFISFFLLPAMAQAGPAGAPVMQGLQQRKVLTVIPIVAVVTLLSGFRLMQITSGGVWGDYFMTTSGATYGVTALIALAAFLVGVFVGRPATLRVQKLAHMTSSAETDREMLLAEIRKLQIRSALAMRITAILLLVSASGMAVARYL
jgi:uncharacterized membrane protein